MFTFPTTFWNKIKVSISKEDFPYVSVVIEYIPYLIPHGGLPFFLKDRSDMLVRTLLQMGHCSPQLVTAIPEGKTKPRGIKNIFSYFLVATL